MIPDVTLPAGLLALAFVAGLTLIYRRWLAHERARFEEIRRRERLRILLRGNQK
jgi:hypothetical protein